MWDVAVTCGGKKWALHPHTAFHRGGPSLTTSRRPPDRHPPPRPVAEDLVVIVEVLLELDAPAALMQHMSRLSDASEEEAACIHATLR